MFDGSNTLVDQFVYTLHPTGRREVITELGGRVSSYVYDDLYRMGSESITDAVNRNHNSSYGYDAVGNRISSIINGINDSYSYDDNDQVTSSGGDSYSYDANGNTLTKTVNGVTTTNVYDLRNKLVSSTTSGTATTFDYDVNGLRSERSSGGSSTLFITDSNRGYGQVVAEVTDGAFVRGYSFGDDLVSQVFPGGNVFFYHYDGLGSTRSLSDVTGLFTDEYDYEAFGELTGSIGTTGNDYLFAGEQFDGALGNYYLRARYYDQGVGRFTQMDTWIGSDFSPASLHKYLYANGDPVGLVDPNGFFSISSLLSGISVQSVLVTVALPTVLTGSTFTPIGSGRSPEFDSGAPLYHFYELETTICNTTHILCNLDSVFEKLRRYPAPGWNDSALVNSGDRTSIRFLGLSGGQVVHQVFSNESRVRNITLPGHIFEEGYVDRIVVKKGSQIRVQSVGEGINRSIAQKFLNLMLARPGFNILDNQIKSSIRN